VRIERQSGENELQYHKRLINGKLSDKTLADMDYSELSTYVYGKEYSSDVARRMMYGSSKTLDLIDKYMDSMVDADRVDELEMKRIELEKEKNKFFDQRRAYSKMIRDESREEELDEIIRRAVEDGNIPELNYERNEVSLVSDNDLIVSLNDIHYGADVKNYWREYNPDICRNMMCRYLDKIIDIGYQNGSQNCYVMCNGDMISGNIHYSIAVTNKENVVEQIIGVSELISEFIAHLSAHFDNVYFISVAGNHSRVNPDKNNALYSERLDDLVGWYIKARLQNYGNVHMDAGEKIDSSMYLIDIRGKTYCGVHGDYDGSASKVQALQSMAGCPLYAVMSGHMHHNKTDIVQGVRTLMAGSFLGVDDYCVQKRIYGKPEQMVCVCDSNGIRCHYDIEL